MLQDSCTRSYEPCKSEIWLFGLIEASIVAYTLFVPLGTVQYEYLLLSTYGIVQLIRQPHFA